MTATKYQNALQELSFQDLIFLISLSKTRNMSQTATELQFSVSSATRHLAHLREIFKDELFVRSGQVLVPTPRMLELEGLITDLLENSKRLFERETINLGESERQLRLAVSDHLFHSPFTRVILKRFFTVAPHAVWNMTPADNRLFDRLRENLIDVALYLGNDTHKEEFHSVDLYRGRYGMLVREDHPLVAMSGPQRTVNKDMIAPFRSIRYIYIDGAPSEEEERMRLAVGQPVGVVTPYNTSIPVIIEETNYTFIGPLITLNRYVHSSADPGRFRVLKLAEDYGYFVPKLIWHHRSHSDPFLQWARALIIDTCRTEAQALDNTVLEA